MCQKSVYLRTEIITQSGVIEVNVVNAKHEKNIFVRISNNIKGNADCITFHDSFKSAVLNIDTLNIGRYLIMVKAEVFR